MLSDKWPPVMSLSSDILSLHREKSLCWRVSGSNGAFYLPGVAAAALHLFLHWRPWQYKPHSSVQRFCKCTSLLPDHHHTAVKRGTPLRQTYVWNQDERMTVQHTLCNCDEAMSVWQLMVVVYKNINYKNLMNPLVFLVWLFFHEYLSFVCLLIISWF